jgi:hypothetical protein
MTTTRLLSVSCPHCGAAHITTEPGVDKDGLPTGAVLAECAGCGWELAELTAPPPSAEAAVDALRPGFDADLITRR